ncbi:MAG TPA: Fur family transcriptional regulator [Solirubrobacterales bacterium]|nr:Fur family transcriptional regulator [Solirubrobacterales bacterium]
MAHPPASDWESSAREALSEGGHRAGGAREAVVSLLARQSCCLSAQEISDGLRESGRDVGIASIYRALDLLGELGLVQRVEIGDGGARFEPVVPGGEHHHHAVCDTCGRVTAFEDERLEEQLERLAGRLRHSMSGHDIVIHGDCARCAGRR